MSPNIRTGIISLFFKDEDRRDDLRNYRPITVPCPLCKIIRRAMALQLGTVLPHLVDSVQAAFQPNKCTSDITRLVQDLINYCEEHDISGILAFCDQEKAYDRVNWNFLIAVLTHLRIPQNFINLVRLLLHDNILHAKVN